MAGVSCILELEVYSQCTPLLTYVVVESHSKPCSDCLSNIYNVNRDIAYLFALLTRRCGTPGFLNTGPFRRPREVALKFSRSLLSISVLGVDINNVRLLRPVIFPL